MNSRNFEDDLIEALGKSSQDQIVKNLLDQMDELPEVSVGDLDLLDDTLDYYYMNTGVSFLFSKNGKLICVKVYFAKNENYKKFNGHYNDFMTSETTKNKIIQRLGKPARENNEVTHTFGLLTPRWIAYDYNHYSINYSFEETTNKLAKISLMTPDCTPGRLT